MSRFAPKCQRRKRSPFVCDSRTGISHGICAVETSRQMPLLQFMQSHWLLWLSYVPDKSAGTYLKLHANGMITMETLQLNGDIENIQVIKPKGV